MLRQTKFDLLILVGITIAVLATSFSFNGCAHTRSGYESYTVTTTEQLDEDGNVTEREVQDQRESIKRKSDRTLGTGEDELAATVVVDNPGTDGGGYSVKFDGKAKDDTTRIADSIDRAVDQLVPIMAQYEGMKATDPANTPPLRDFLTSAFTAIAASSGGGGLVSILGSLFGGGG